MPEHEHDRRLVRTSREWIAYFTANAANRRPIPWQLGAAVTEAELSEIAVSLRAWQLAETSDGSHLVAAATQYAVATGDSDFVAAAKLFIREEQGHGGVLGRFLDLAGVDRAEADWGDSLFRRARHAWPRMEVWVTPVVMVETAALIYYNAIRHATASPVLRAICSQLLADEVPHIRFQCERLAILHRRRPRWLRSLTMGFHRLMFAGVTLAIWIAHRRALRAGGYTFADYRRAMWRKMQYSWRIMSPDAYRWSEEPSPAAEFAAETA
jgi:hypothetical protein